MKKELNRATMLPWRNEKQHSTTSIIQPGIFRPARGEKEAEPAVSTSKRQAVAITLGASYEHWAVE